MLKRTAVRQPALALSATLLLLLQIAGQTAFTGEAPAPKPPVPSPAPTSKTAGVLPEVNWSAVKQSFDEAKNAVVLTGSAWVRFRGNKLEADNIVFFRESREMYAEGNCRLRTGESEIAAQAVYIDVPNETGYLIDATVRVSTAPSDLTGKKGSGVLRADSRTALSQEEKPANPLRGTTLLNRSRDLYGTYLLPVQDPQARTNVVFKAEKIVKQSRLLYTAENAYLTPDDMVHPMYGLKVGELDFYMYEAGDQANPEQRDLKPQKIVAKAARIDILGFTLFPFPTVTYDMVKRQSYVESHFGRSSRFGYFALNRMGYNLGPGEDKSFAPTHVYLDVDERSARGPALGGEVDWQTGARPIDGTGDKNSLERGYGRLRVYSLDEIQTSRTDDVNRAKRDLERRIQPRIDGFPRRQYDANLLFVRRRELDNAGPPSFDLQEHRDDFRGFVDFQHHQPLRRFAGIDNLVVDLKYQRDSDRDFMHEYFPRDYISQGQSEALASIRKPGDNYSLELLYRTNPEPFDASAPRSPVEHGVFTGYEPALTYSLTPTPIAGGFYVSTEVQAARMKRYFERDIYDQHNLEAGRAYGIVDISRPFKWGPVNIVPHVGTQQAGYDNSRDDGAIGQGAATYGLDLTSRFYGTFPDLENEALGLKNGMRHIIEPRISYRGISDTTVDPVKVFDFDEVDNLTAIDRVTFAIDQTFQTHLEKKDGTGMSTYNFAGLDTALDYYPRNRDQQRLLHGDALDLWRTDGYFRVLDTFRLGASVGLRPEDFKTETSAYSLTIDPGTRWRVKVEERFNYSELRRAIFGSDQVSVRLDYQVSERWGFMLEEIRERRKSLLTLQGRQVERIGLTRSYGPLDATFAYSIDRNQNDHSVYASVRPTASYRNVIVPSQDLLVAQGEVSGDQEAPEERNFDPFDLLKKHKKSKTAPTPRNKDVPQPPQPGSTAGAFRDPDSLGAKSADVFRSPDENRQKPPIRLDTDDWTTPAVPATNRQK
ncbi:MAG TPA: LPS assembly protein LptD [Planctomycetota bacterium]|jgi:hypothetical protein